MNGIQQPAKPIHFLDRDRVTCLLLINTQLMKKAINLYHNVLINPQTLTRLLPQDKKNVIEQYQNYTRRLHCNLQVLSFIHEKYHMDPASNQNQPSNKISFPFVLSPPPDMPELTQLYNKLQELYPEAIQFLKMKMQQSKANPNAPQIPQLFGQQLQPPNPGIPRGVPTRPPGTQLYQQYPTPNHQSPMMNNSMPPQSSMSLNQPTPMAANSPMMNNMMPNQMVQPPTQPQRQQMAKSQPPPPPQNQSYQFNNTFNKNYPVNNVNLMNQQQQQQQRQHQQSPHPPPPPPQQQQQQQQPQALSPQQIFLNNQNSNSAGMFDFFNV